MSMRSEIAHCPKCNGAVPPEDYVHDVPGEMGEVRRFIYCDYCNLGTELSVWPNGEVIPGTFDCGKNPKGFAKFMRRLGAARERSSHAQPVAG